MTNLEIANRVIENSKVTFSLTYSNAHPDEKYLDALQEQIEDAWVDCSECLEKEWVEMEETGYDMENYIHHNIIAQIEDAVNIWERDETISINVSL